MGGSKKQTVGYSYKLLLQYGICRGPIDAFLEMRGGNRTAWTGVQTTSGTIVITAPHLWGGDESEGGIEGHGDVRLGTQDQMPSAYLIEHFGEKQSALRGKCTFTFKGGIFGNNPYPKTVAFKVQRIKKGWDDDECWYPEKAEITAASAIATQLDAISGDWKYNNTAGDESRASPSFDDSGWASGAMPFASALGHPYASDGGYPDAVGTVWPVNTVMWMRKTFRIDKPIDILMEIFVDNYSTVWVNGEVVLPRIGSASSPSQASFRHGFTIPASVLHSGNNLLVIRGEDMGTYTYAGFKVLGGIDVAGKWMNPAHILFDSLTQKDMQGEPVWNVDDASFRAAADRLASEGFGLCTTYDHASEDIEKFQERILTVIGAKLSQDRLDGRYRLDLIRGDYDPETLPILTDADIIEYAREPSDPNTAVNEVVVEWFDQEKKEKRATAPMQSLGAIMTAGAVISETMKFPEIPQEDLALRVAARELRAKSTPLNRFTMTTTRKTYAWRAGEFFRLQAPRRGIADMICMVGEISAGTLRSGVMRMTALQDVSRMPATTYVTVEPGIDTSPATTPEIAADQTMMEASYMELAGVMSSADIAAIDEDSGYILAAAQQPSAGLNYSLYTKTGAEEYADRGIQDWTPTAKIVEAATLDTTEVDFTLAEGSNLDRVTAGTAALWGAETVRVDAIDPSAMTITVARAVGDSVPHAHDEQETIWFYDAWNATDGREYLVGESVSAKVLTRLSSAQLPIDAATPMTVTMNQRAARPYPPAKVRVNGVWPAPEIIEGDAMIEWVHRNRITQGDQVIAWEDASIAPEDGTEYFAEVLDASNAVVQTTTPTATASIPALTITPSGEYTIRLLSLRDGLQSWQPVSFKAYIDATGDTRKTEGGEYRVYEDGSIKITED